MKYDVPFYTEYAKYLQETGVRNQHGFPIGAARRIASFQNVIDLGCGLQEFLLYGVPEVYIGVDANAPLELNPNSQTRRAELYRIDYRSPEFFQNPEIFAASPTAFVSLFSSEITACPQVNYSYYGRLFQAVPSLKHGLVSGFYYTHQKHAPIVEEIPGLYSYQTLTSVEDTHYLAKREGFLEIYWSFPCPSALFGPNVIEVWKLFRRRPAQ